VAYVENRVNVNKNNFEEKWWSLKKVGYNCWQRNIVGNRKCRVKTAKSTKESYTTFDCKCNVKINIQIKEKNS
jgi:hypothetical protein